jgi:hypothetical protein
VIGGGRLTEALQRVIDDVAAWCVRRSTGRDLTETDSGEVISASVQTAPSPTQTGQLETPDADRDPGGDTEGGGAVSEEEARQSEEAGECKDQPKLSTRQENVLEALLDNGAVNRDNRISRQMIVQSINPNNNVSTYRRAFDGLSAAEYTQGESGADGGIWLTPAGRQRAEQVKCRNDSTGE